MDIYSIIIIAAFGISVVLGFLFGFGKTLTFLTKGIIGAIISIVVCAMFGGVIANIPFVADLIVKGNEYFGSKAQILATLHVATIVYYIILFFIVTIIRIIIVRIIRSIFESGKGKEGDGFNVMGMINRILGVILFGAFCVLFVYLIMAVLALLTDVESIRTFLETSEQNGTFFYKMYSHNPIDLTAILGKVAEKAAEATAA